MGGISQSEPAHSSFEQEWREQQEHIVKARARSIAGFWRNLKSSRKYRLQVLDDHVEISAPRGYEPDCSACLDPCCASPRSVVSLRLLDVARLVDAGLAEGIAVHDGHSAVHEATRQVLREKSHLDTWRYFPFLRKRSDGSCIFFENGRCSAYEHRPLQCRAFPYQVDEEAAQIRWAGFCRSKMRRVSQKTEARDIEAARESYHEKLRDLMTRIHAPELVTLERRFPGPVRERFDQSG